MGLFGSMLASELVEGVKRRAFLPEAQNTLDDQDILKFLNEELKDSVLPLILQFHEEFLVYIKDVPIAGDQSVYKIPYRAIGRKLRDVKYKDTSMSVFPMTRILPEDRNYFQETGFNPWKTFYMRGDEIVLVPGVSSLPVGWLSMMYSMQPNKIVLEERAGIIQSFDQPTGVITLDQIPSNITAGSLIDFVEAKPGHKLFYYDVPVLSVDPTAKTVTVDPSSILTNFSISIQPAYKCELQVGDYVNTAGEAVMAQIPSELNSLLTERGAARCLASLGHTENLQAANAKIQELEAKSGSLIDNRSEGEPMKVNNLNSMLRQSKISRRRFYF